MISNRSKFLNYTLLGRFTYHYSWQLLKTITPYLPPQPQDEEQEVGYSKFKDLPKATILVFSRLPFVCITIGACLESFVIAVAGAFLPKIIETQFYQPPGKAALLYGLIAIPCALVGNMLGECTV